jgi:hypothetical protein
VEIEKRPPLPLRNAVNEFRQDLAIYQSKIDKLPVSMVRKRIHHAVPANKTILPPESPPESLSPPNIQEKALSLSPLNMEQDSLSSPAIDDPPHLQLRKEKAISAAVVVNTFTQTIDPKEFPTLASKGICLQTDKDITPILRDVLKLTKKVKPSGVDLLKVLHYNDSTTSLVEVPCSARQSGFKKQARRSRWIHRILQCVRKYKEEELVADDEREEDDEFAYTDNNAARWLITYLGESYPSEFIKSAQALDMPIHQGKMTAEYTTAMWSDAGVGVAAQRIIMRHFIDYFGYKFTVAEASINKLAVDSVPPVVGTVQYMDRTLDYWYKDLELLLAGQIAKEQNNQPAFSYDTLDIVIGADHGQGSFRVGVKVIYRNGDGSIKATAIYGLGEIECQKDTGKLLALAFTPMLNAALRRIVKYERDENGKILSDGSLAIYTKNIVDHVGAEGDSSVDRVGTENSSLDGARTEGEPKGCFYAILDRTGPFCDEDTLVLNVPIRIFITGDLAFYATVVGKNSQWTGENRLLSPEDIIRLDELDDRLNNIDSLGFENSRTKNLGII